MATFWANWCIMLSSKREVNMPDILKSRKFQILVIGVIVEIAISLVPDLEGSRTALITAVGALFAALMGMHTLTDITAIKNGK